MSSKSVVKHEVAFLERIYSYLKIKAIATPNVIQKKYVTNVIQETTQGKLVVRMYSENWSGKLETGSPMFEVEALQFFSGRGLPVPVPLKINEIFLIKMDDKIAFAYFYVPGKPIEQSELSVELAKDLGNFLNRMLQISITYPLNCERESTFINSFEHVLDAASKLEQQIDVSTLHLWATMKENTHAAKDILANTPKGICHADYYFENILKNGDGIVCGILDFGDAYFGHVLHDVVIGAMESCVLTDGTWDFKMFISFLQGVSTFLETNAITFQQFLEALKLNCFRFAIYTLCSTGIEGVPLETNNYVIRYKCLLNDVFKRDVLSAYTQVLKN